MSFQVDLRGLQDTKSLARYIASISKVGDVLLLKGNLGSGKTAFTRFFVGSLVDDAYVSSPTFSLVNVYDGSRYEIWHYDLYRVKHREELRELGIDDALSNAITVIEWPELIEESISNDGVVVSLQSSGESDARTANLTLLGRFSERAEEVRSFIKGLNDSR